LGTEMGSIYFVDSQAYTVIRKDNIDAVPVKILPTGFFRKYFFNFREFCYLLKSFLT